jgi:choline dehydrogenase-like flavoprotein
MVASAIWLNHRTYPLKIVEPNDSSTALLVYFAASFRLSHHVELLTLGDERECDEILFDVPGTAHCIGGCVVADPPAQSVIHDHHRVFNYKTVYICDGSVVLANLGVESQPDHQ